VRLLQEAPPDEFKLITGDEHRHYTYIVATKKSGGVVSVLMLTFDPVRDLFGWSSMYGYPVLLPQKSFKNAVAEAIVNGWKVHALEKIDELKALIENEERM